VLDPIGVVQRRPAPLHIGLELEDDRLVDLERLPATGLLVFKLDRTQPLDVMSVA